MPKVEQRSISVFQLLRNLRFPYSLPQGGSYFTYRTMDWVQDVKKSHKAEGATLLHHPETRNWKPWGIFSHSCRIRRTKRWGAGEQSWQGVTKSTWATIVFCLGALELGEVGVHPDQVFCLSGKISPGSDSLVTVVTSSLQISVVSWSLSEKRHHGSELPGTHILLSFLGPTVWISVVHAESNQLWALQQVLVPILFLLWPKRTWKKNHSIFFWSLQEALPSSRISMVDRCTMAVTGQRWREDHPTVELNSWQCIDLCFPLQKPFQGPWVPVAENSVLPGQRLLYTQWEILKMSCRHSRDWRTKLHCKFNVSKRPK